jgi:aminomethyltransferase
MTDLARTPLYQWHENNGAKLVDFAGWAMPIHYGSIVNEHQATRTGIGLFDVSHMGRFCFTGPAAARLLDGLLTRPASSLKPGTVRYALVTNDSGGVLDDVLVSHLTVQDQSFYWLVVNASNRQKLLEWIEPRIGNYDVAFSDETVNTAMIAVQGPRSIELVDSMFSDGKPSDLKYFTASNGLLNGVPVSVSRTGYTGEDGVEFVLPANDALAVWERLVEGMGAFGGSAAGLGARDTLRLESAMPLYGHELSESISPYEAGLGFAVKLSERQFPGRDALAAESQQESPAKRVRIGLALDGKRVPREGYKILLDQNEVGVVTSGTFSPTLEMPIAMGFVAPTAATIGMELSIDVRGKLLPARVVELPFYKRK